MKNAVFFALLCATPAAADTFTYDHNGSAMAVDVTNSRVVIRYTTPHAGLRAQGVTPGTLLFAGAVTDGYLDGQSRIFSAACEAIDYFVYGDFVAGQSFTLKGAAPVLASTGCTIVDNTTTGPNATLVFAAERAAQSGCLRGVNTSLNVRVGPGQDYAVIAELPADTCNVTPITACAPAWCAIRAGNVTGWVSRQYLAP